MTRNGFLGEACTPDYRARRLAGERKAGEGDERARLDPARFYKRG
jgi:hypothetical protein